MRRNEPDSCWMVSDLRLPRKSLAKYVSDLEQRATVETQKSSGAGGSHISIRLQDAASDLTERELRSLFEQSQFWFALQDLRPLQEVLEGLGDGPVVGIGIPGEMLAIHICMTLGLRVVA